MEYAAIMKLASDKNMQDRGSPTVCTDTGSTCNHGRWGLASVTKREERQNDFVLPNEAEDVHRWSESS